MKPQTKTLPSLTIIDLAILYNNKEIFKTIELVNPTYLIVLALIFIIQSFLIGILNN